MLRPAARQKTMTATPTNIARNSEEELQITWDDGKVMNYSVATLREICPCATCREKRNAKPQATNELQVLSHAELQPTRVIGMKPVGNYAYNIQFNDGHDTGIFTFEFLRKAGIEAA